MGLHLGLQPAAWQAAHNPGPATCGLGGGAGEYKVWTANFRGNPIPVALGRLLSCWGGTFQ